MCSAVFKRFVRLARLRVGARFTRASSSATMDTALFWLALALPALFALPRLRGAVAVPVPWRSCKFRAERRVHVRQCVHLVSSRTMVHACACACVRTCVHTWGRTHTHTHTHSQAPSCSPSRLVCPAAAGDMPTGHSVAVAGDLASQQAQLRASRQIPALLGLASPPCPSGITAQKPKVQAAAAPQVSSAPSRHWQSGVCIMLRDCAHGMCCGQAGDAHGHMQCTTYVESAEVLKRHFCCRLASCSLCAPGWPYSLPFGFGSAAASAHARRTHCAGLGRGSP